MKELALQLTELRLAKKMTPVELSNASGVHLKTIRDLECGATDIDICYLVDICKALDCTLDIKFVKGRSDDTP